MTFRHRKSNTRRQSRAWSAWVESNRAALLSFGLPAAVYLDEERWLDFLENGHLHWHEDSTHFAFDDLSIGQLDALRRFLEQQYGHSEQCPPLLRWLRVRCGEPATEGGP
jgi:hypothetical protein